MRALVALSGAEGDELPQQQEDWRAVRARLVAQEAKGLGEAAEPQAQENEPQAQQEGWVHETPLIEQGSVILASTQQRWGFALHQQYFHKSVMLVLSHGPDFTRGIILNRPTPFTNGEDGWPLWFGGDVQSFSDERGSREVTCLHTLRSPAAERMSVKVIEGIYYTSYECARDLVEQGVATKDDFWTFCGYAGWGRGQLQDELDRPEGSSWRLASADGGVVLRKLLGQKREGPDSDGIATWESLMRVIGYGASEVDASAGGFADRMLHEWIRVHLRMSAVLGPPALLSTPSPVAPPALRPGDVLCAQPVVSSFTLDNQWLHKSVVLLLRTGRSGTVGVLINRPSSTRVESRADGRRWRVLFGGGLTLRDEAVIWLHRKEAIGGERLGLTDLWRIGGEQATTAINVGSAREEDLLLVHGVLAWGPNALEREIAAGHFAVTGASSVPWDDVWALANPRDKGADPESAKAAVGSTRDGCGIPIWRKVMARGRSKDEEGRGVVDGDEDLADLALLKWADTFLL